LRRSVIFDEGLILIASTLHSHSNNKFYRTNRLFHFQYPKEFFQTFRKESKTNITITWLFWFLKIRPNYMNYNVGFTNIDRLSEWCNFEIHCDSTMNTINLIINHMNQRNSTKTLLMVWKSFEFGWNVLISVWNPYFISQIDNNTNDNQSESAIQLTSSRKKRTERKTNRDFRGKPVFDIEMFHRG
jgi:hypothetical protein